VQQKSGVRTANNRKRIKSARTNGKKGGRPITQRVMSGLAKDNPSLTQQEPEAKLPKPKPKPEPKPNINTVAGASRLNGAQHEISSDLTPVVMALPLREGGDFDVRQSLVAELEPLYPHVDIHYVEAGRMRAVRWCEARGLRTVEQKKEYCRKLSKQLLKPMREPGEDEEEKAA
jgi:hypothetical protein